MPKEKAKQRETVLIYYGPDSDPKSLSWRMDVVDAKETVRPNGSLLDALLGRAGSTFGCHLSNCGWRNKDDFPHACLTKPSFTRSRAYVIVKFYAKPRKKTGAVGMCVRYAHTYGALVGLNDKDKQRIYIKAHPELAEQQFVLSPPPVSVKRKPGRKRGKNTGEREPNMNFAKGALRRAIDAGLINPGLHV